MALFKPGEGGRPKGSKNRFKITSIKDYFEDKKIQPIDEMWKLYNQINDPVAKMAFWIKILPWVETRSQKIENVGERTSENPTGLETRADGHLLEVLQPKQAANDK